MKLNNPVNAGTTIADINTKFLSIDTRMTEFAHEHHGTGSESVFRRMLLFDFKRRFINRVKLTFFGPLTEDENSLFDSIDASFLGL